MTTDRYGCTVALVDVNGQSLNNYLVQEGYAWVYSKYCKKSFCRDWKKTEALARYQEKCM
ncbi:thermonuclease family protein [Desulfogranum marinum]|uniref:thermonuclease family protein n=1 Tax=Desulfogranum marinum TaxID=453220 RepID=UPI00374CEE3E